MTISQAFDQLDRNLCVSMSTRNLISNRHNNIAKRVNYDFRGLSGSTSNTRYVGSYGRGTAIEGISDIDMLMVLPYDTYYKYNNYSYNGQSALLQAVKNSIKVTYPNTDLKGDGQIVQVSFSDGMMFEIVPCFLNNDGSYTYPDSNGGGSWLTTNPVPEIEAIKQMNAGCNGNLYPLCRMTRAWKDQHSIDIKGYMIDLMAYRFLSNYEHRTKTSVYHDYMMRDFFLYLSEVSYTQASFRMPGSNRLYDNRGYFQYAAGKAFEAAIEAIEKDEKGYHYTAYNKWREVFGNDFPFYQE